MNGEGRSSGACHLAPTCELGPHAQADHPCGQRADKPGEVCRPCLHYDGVRRIVRPDGTCVCMIAVEDIPHADLKALMAGIGLSLQKEQS